MSLTRMFWKKFTHPKMYSAMGEESPALVDILENKKLISCSGKYVDLEKVLKDKKIIAYYFSASWCSPCKHLLPKIKSLFKESKKLKVGLEIIFVSSDVDADIMLSYFKEKHSDWYAVPFEDAGAEKLRIIYGISHIPQVIVVRENGTIISRTGKKDIETLGINALVAWNVDPK